MFCQASVENGFAGRNGLRREVIISYGFSAVLYPLLVNKFIITKIREALGMIAAALLLWKNTVICGIIRGSDLSFLRVLRERKLTT